MYYNKAEKAYLKKLEKVPTHIKCKSPCQLQMAIICTFRKCHESYTHLFHCLGLSSQTYHHNDNVCSQTMLQHWHSTHYYSAIGEEKHTSNQSQLSWAVLSPGCSNGASAKQSIHWLYYLSRQRCVGLEPIPADAG